MKIDDNAERGRGGALLGKIPCFGTENAQKMEYGESTEPLYISSVVPIRLYTKYHRKQVQNFRTLMSTECVGKLLIRNVL